MLEWRNYVHKNSNMAPKDLLKAWEITTSKDYSSKRGQGGGSYERRNRRATTDKDDGSDAEGDDEPQIRVTLAHPHLARRGKTGAEVVTVLNSKDVS